MIVKKITFIALLCSILFSMHSSFGMRRVAQTTAQAYGRATPRVAAPGRTIGEPITSVTSGKLPISSETKRALSSNVPVNPLRGYRAPEINAPQQLFSGAQSAIQPPTEPLSVPLTGPLSLEEVIEKLKTSQPVDTESFKRAIKNAQDKGIKTIFIQQSVVDSLPDLFSPLLPNNTSTTHIIEHEGKKIFEAHRTPAGLICLVTNVADLRPVAIGKQITKESLIKNFNIPAGANESVGFSTEDMTSWLKKVFTPAITQTTLLETAARQAQIAEQITKETQDREEKAKQRQLKKQKAAEQKATAIKQAQKEELDRLVAEKQAAEQKEAEELRIKTEKLEAEKTAKEKQIALKAEKAAKKVEAQKRETALIQAVEKAKQLAGNKAPQPQEQRAAQPKSADSQPNKTNPAGDESEFHLEAAEAEVDMLLKDFEKNTQRSIKKIESELSELKKQNKQTVINETKQKELANEIAQLQKQLERQKIQSIQQKSNLEKMETETLQAKQKAQETSDRANNLQAATDQIILEAQLMRDTKIIAAKKSEAEALKKLDAEANIEKERILTQFETAKKELSKTESFKKLSRKQQEKKTEQLNQEMLKQINAENKSIFTQKTQLLKKLDQQLAKDLNALDAQKLKEQKSLNKKSATEIQQIKNQTTARLAILEKEHQELIAAEQKELEQQRLAELEQIKRQDAEQLTANKVALESAERQRLIDLDAQRAKDAEQNNADLAAKQQQDETDAIVEQLRIAELQRASQQQAQLDQQAEEQRLGQLEQIKRQDAEQLTADKAALESAEQQRLIDLDAQRAKDAEQNNADFAAKQQQEENDRVAEQLIQTIQQQEAARIAEQNEQERLTELEQIKKDIAWQQSIESINKSNAKTADSSPNEPLPKKIAEMNPKPRTSPEEIDQERLNTLQQLRENDAKQITEQIKQAEDLRLAELIKTQDNDAAQKAAEAKAFEDAEQERLAELESMRQEQNEQQRLAELEQANKQDAERLTASSDAFEMAEQQRLRELDIQRTKDAEQEAADLAAERQQEEFDRIARLQAVEESQKTTQLQAQLDQQAEQQRLSQLEEINRQEAEQIASENAAWQAAEQQRLADLEQTKKDSAWQQSIELINKSKTKTAQPESNNPLPKKTPNTQSIQHISPEEMDQERLNTLQQLAENDAKQMNEQINQNENLRLAELITAQDYDAAQKDAENQAFEDAEQERLAALQLLKEQDNEQEARRLAVILQQEEDDRIAEQLRIEELQNATQQQAEVDQQAEEQRLAELNLLQQEDSAQEIERIQALKATDEQRLFELEQIKKDIAWQESVESINNSKNKTPDSAPENSLPKKILDITPKAHTSPEEIDQERLNTLQQLRENDADHINQQIFQSEQQRLAELAISQNNESSQQATQTKAFEDAEQERLAELQSLKEKQNEQEADDLAVFLQQQKANELEKAALLAEQQKLAELERIRNNEAQEIHNAERLIALQLQQKNSLPIEYEPTEPRKYSDIKTKEPIFPADTPEQPLQQWPMTNPIIAITPQLPIATFPTLQSEPFLPATADEFPPHEYFQYQPPQSFMDFLPGEELPPLAPQQFIAQPQPMTVEQATQESHKEAEKIAADLAKAEQREQQHEEKTTAQEKQIIAETVEKFTEKMPIIMPLPDGYSPTQRVVTQRPSSNTSTQSSLSRPSYYQSRSPQLNASMPMAYFPQTYSQAPTYSDSSYSFDQPTTTTYSSEMPLYQTPLQDLLLTDYTYVPLELEENTPETVAENTANAPSNYDIPPIIALEEPEPTETLLEEKKELTTTASPTRTEQETTKPLPSIKEKIEDKPQTTEPTETPQEPKKVSFFWKILQAIIRFFRNLLGYTSPMASG